MELAEVRSTAHFNKIKQILKPKKVRTIHLNGTCRIGLTTLMVLTLMFGNSSRRLGNLFEQGVRVLFVLPEVTCWNEKAHNNECKQNKSAKWHCGRHTL